MQSIIATETKNWHTSAQYKKAHNHAHTYLLIHSGLSRLADCPNEIHRSMATITVSSNITQQNHRMSYAREKLQCTRHALSTCVITCKRMRQLPSSFLRLLLCCCVTKTPYDIWLRYSSLLEKRFGFCRTKITSKMITFHLFQEFILILVNS